MKKKTNDYSSVQKAIEILMSFVPHGEEMGTLELSRKLGIHKSTVSRLMGVLTYHNLLKHDPETKKYTLGRAITDLGSAANLAVTNQIIKIAQPIMNQLRDSVRESVSLEVMSKNAVILVSEAPGPPPVSVAFTAGQQIPMHVSSGSKAILAFSSPELVNFCISGELKSYTRNTITNADVFKEHLRKIAKKGVSFDRGEYNMNVHSVGAPIFDHAQKPIAAISVCAIADKMKSLIKADLVSQVKSAANKISVKVCSLEDEAKHREQ